MRQHPFLGRLTALCVAILCAPAGAADASKPPLVAVTAIGPTTVLFSARRDACDGDDVPDASARAFWDGDGHIVLFGLHTLNRSLRGASFDTLKIDCAPTLRSGGNAEPSAYDDASWIAATWTADGRAVAALIHHEYQANTHPGRCRAKEYLACWYNSVVAAASGDGGRSFRRATPPVVVAAAPFRQEVGQGRHRGFFNPSNIFAKDGAWYMLAPTTGWSGQDGGACLFRTERPSDPASWRAYDGAGFTIVYADPYRRESQPKPCRTIAPFPATVGAVVRHRGSGAYVAVFQASRNATTFPQPGFYATASRDLLTWDTPRLVLAGPTLFDDPCGSGGRLIAYPSLIDPAASGRNFDDVGDTALLFYATLRVEGCQVTSDRDLLRQEVAVRVLVQ